MKYRKINLLIVVVVMASSVTAEEEPNPLLETARAFLQSQGNGGGGMGLLQSFMQSEGGRQLGDMLTGKSGSEGTSDILSGLGSLLGGGGGKGMDPQMIGQLVNMFMSQAGSNVDVNNNEVGKEKSGIDWESMMGLASNLMAAQQGGGKSDGGGGGMEGLLNVLPVLMQAFGGAEDSHESMKVESIHRNHQHQSNSALPPFMETLYDYWEHFKSSDLGKAIWHNSGLEAVATLFTDKDGHFEMERIIHSLENATFRRRWIRSLSSFVAEWIAHVSDPATQTRYLATAQFVVNGFLKAQGYPKATLLDLARPAESLSQLVNTVFKRQFALKVNSAVYIKPAVNYIQEMYRLGQSKGLSRLNSRDIENKLAETINGELIEPILRVWRAYKYATYNPQCDQYVVCAINKRDSFQGRQGAGLRPGVTKLASITASWFLSSNTGRPFWQLYTAATEDHNCQKYSQQCSSFDEEDIKATTEYAHSEL